MNLNLKNKIIAFSLFACIGITGEIFFTAIYDNILRVINHEGVDWKLEGNSYIWMYFIYGIIALVPVKFMDWLLKFPVLLRLLFYSFGIYVVEFSSGFLLDQLTGKCPWQYTTGLQIMGYIRLDYLPVWMFFSFLVEKIYHGVKRTGLLS